MCWIRSTDHLLPLEHFQIHDSIVAHNGPLHCPNDFEAHLNSYDYFTDLHAIKLHFYVSVTQRWVVVRESACNHSDLWRTMKCFVLELRKELNERMAGTAAGSMQLPNISRYRAPRRRQRRMGKCSEYLLVTLSACGLLLIVNPASASANGLKNDQSKSHFVNQAPASASSRKVSESNLGPVHQTSAEASDRTGNGSNSESVNPEYLSGLKSRKDSAQPKSSFGDDKTKRDPAQIWRQP